MKVTVTLVGGVAVDLEANDPAEVAKWEAAIQGKQRTFTGAVYGGGGRRRIVAEAVTCITVYDDPPATNRGRRQ